MTSEPRWLRTSASLIALVLATVLVAGPLWVLWTNQRPPTAPQQQRLSWNLKTSSRLNGDTPGQLAVAANRARFPDPARRGPGAVVIVGGDDPAFALAAAALAAPPLNGALLPTTGVDTGVVQRELARLRAPRVLALGDVPGAESLGGADPVLAAAEVARLVTASRGAPPVRVLLADVEEATEILPLLAWLAFSGDVLLFTRAGSIPIETNDVLRQFGGVEAIYRTARAAEVPPGLATRIGTLPDLRGARGAVRLAEYHDPAGGLGWGYDRSRRDAHHRYIIARAQDWQGAFAAATLAPAIRAPLLWSGARGLAGPTEAYLWKIKPEFYESPAEGPFHHTWIAGDLARVSFGAQARADLALEISNYRVKGDGGASALELVFIGWIGAAVLLAVWVAIHASRRLRGMHWTMKWGWPLLVLVTGPLGLWWYIAQYRRQPRMDLDMHGRVMSMWHRPPGSQVLSATAMGVAFDMPLMVAVSWLVTIWTGLPPIIFAGPAFWIGQSMVVAMLIAYVVPLLAATLFYEAPMQMMFRRVGYGEGLRRSWVPMTAAMTAGWIGMMGSMWWLHMIYPIGMDMPEEDEIRWWGFIAVAVLVGVLFEWVVNVWLVRTRRRPTTM